MKQIIKSIASDYPMLVLIWERSVRASHKFLNEDDINDIRENLISNYFPHVSLYTLIDNDNIGGFIGIADDRIEMLFIDSALRGRGYGSALIKFAKEKGCRFVDVNEQNPEALGFYLSKGFHVVSRDDTDNCGRPYPILHLSL